MKGNTLKAVQSVLAVTASVMMSYSASAALVYDDTSVYSGQFYAPAGGTEFGDEIGLAGTDRTITDFKFEYFTSLTVTTGKTLDFRIYNGTGDHNPPTTLLYDSGPLPVAIGFNHVDINGLQVNVPNNITWTVSFGGLSGTDQAGLPIYQNPTVGSSFDDFWQHTGGTTWTLFRFPNGDPKANFAAQVTAVPEAGTILYGLLGGLLLAASRFCRRFSSKHS